MRKTTFFQLAGIALLILVALAVTVPRPRLRLGPDDPPAAKQIDLVIALDTSSSMDGLIDSARQKLWDIVNVLGKAQPKPVLRVGLLSYGNSGHDPGRGWVQKEAELTSDLDGIYAKLFALRTGGGEEYVGRAVQVAEREMAWDGQALKLLFVAGNEPADQDPLVPVASAVRGARERGIFVNTIYCGQQGAGEAGLWSQVAGLGGGRYAAIDQNSAVAVVTPVDEELGRLSAQLNQTYLGYGREGAQGAARQAAMDQQAAALNSGVLAARTVAKSGALYDNSGWDLIDAVRRGKKSVAAMEAKDLPAPIAALPPESRAAVVEKMAQEREVLQGRIKSLSAKRDAFIAARPRAKGEGASFDEALGGAVIEQAKSAGFAF